MALPIKHHVGDITPAANYQSKQQYKLTKQQYKIICDFPHSIKIINYSVQDFRLHHYKTIAHNRLLNVRL